MCIICVEFEKEKMTTREARRALSEMVMTESLDKEHAKEVEHMLNKADGYWFPEWDIYLPYGTGESD
tara:strand:+ start:3145 stop:3345 length:201 start_codon:yes stop_codon:yes gene_type:complete